MRVSDVRITLAGERGDRDGLLAYCTISFDSVFVVHDIKLVQIGGRRMVSMPSRRISGHCGNCRESNHIRARYCNRCGKPFAAPLLPGNDPVIDRRLKPSKSGAARYFVDVAHPINHKFRADVEAAVFDAYDAAVADELGQSLKRA